MDKDKTHLSSMGIAQIAKLSLYSKNKSKLKQEPNKNRKVNENYKNDTLIKEHISAFCHYISDYPTDTELYEVYDSDRGQEQTLEWFMDKDEFLNWFQEEYEKDEYGFISIKDLYKIYKNSSLFYSLSKPFGLRNIRTGWMFTKKPDERLEALIHSAIHYNYFAHAVAEAVINNFDIDHIYKEVNQYQKIICQKYDLDPSDSVWLGTTTRPLYDKFKR